MLHLVLATQPAKAQTGNYHICFILWSYHRM